ncbi:uncharacterized protein FIESC28_09209 [Fusarium coffeatum]|uniref:DH domain-containing protein n=1 Tax=Fusarium coffeatum TaxID=231269 RepID=A0A366R1L4_9HYPO|nr:uncharacterized protein FIESC28_09209 [Fusarium coffeatum]RBR11064.1 hypothetical protein FIESC28_09209 [Fusarium coffeatum]
MSAQVSMPQPTRTLQGGALYPIPEQDSKPPEIAEFGDESPSTSYPQTALSQAFDHGAEIKDTNRNSPSNGHLVCRQKAIKELLDTETTFTRDMRVVLWVYKATANSCRVLDDQQISIIFRNIDDIAAIHIAFLSELKASVANIYSPDPDQPPMLLSDDLAAISDRDLGSEPSEAEDSATVVGSVFRSYIDKITRVAEEFLDQSDQIAEHLEFIQQDRRVVFWLEECRIASSRLTRAWNLDSLLIKPTQRVTRYPLLLSNILKYTPVGHPDYRDLIKAKELLLTSLTRINVKAEGPHPSLLTMPDDHNTLGTTPGPKIFIKSVNKIKMWSHNLAETVLQTKQTKKSSSTLNSHNDTLEVSTPKSAPDTSPKNLFSPPSGGCKLFLSPQWLQSAPNLLKGPSLSTIYASHADIDDGG